MKRFVAAGISAIALCGFLGCSDATKQTSGYRDEQISAAVETTLRANVPGSISVNTRDRVVTLSGTVPDPGARDRAASLASRVDGVDRVNNNLRTTVAADAPAAAPPAKAPVAPNVQ